MSDRKAAIRLGTEGKGQVIRDLDEIASAGDAGAKRWARAYQRAGEDVEAAMQRQAQAAAKISTFLPASPVQQRVDAMAGPGSVSGKSARDSALAFRELAAEQERLEARTRSFLSALDPTYAAQQRFNVEMAEAKSLVGSGAITLDQYCEKLRQEKAALDTVAGAKARDLQMSGQQRAGYQQLGFQINDIAASYASGGSLMTIFAQQSGQLFQALGLITAGGAGAAGAIQQAGGASDEAAVDVGGLGDSVVGVSEKVENGTGKLGAFAGFMAGPWGAAVVAAISILTPFVAKLFEGEDSLDDLVQKLKEDAAATERAAQAKLLYGQTLDGVIEKQKVLNAELAREQLTQQQVAQGRLDDSRTALVQQVAGIRDAKAAVEQARQEVERTRRQAELASSTASDESGGAQSAYSAAVRALREKVQQYQELTKTALETQTAVRNAQMAISERRVIASLDAATAATERYDTALAKLRTQRSRGQISSTQFEAGIAREQRALKAAQDAAQEAQRQANRTTSLGSQLSAERGTTLLASAREYVGLNENNPSGRSDLQALFRSANINVDPKMVAWCAAFVNAVLATNGLPGTGSLTARSFLNYGTATSKPEQGDIVVLKRGGNAAQGHVGFYAGTGPNGRIMVTGGNQGDAVSTTSFARSDVLGFRRAPTDAATFKDATQQAKEDADALADLTRKYAPLTAAADAYRETLAEIARLNPANAQELKDGARKEYLKSRAGALGDRIGLSGIEVGAREETASAEKRRDEERRREEFIKGMLIDQGEALDLGRAELAMAAAGDDLRERTLAKVRLIADLKRAGVAADSAEGVQILANADAYEAVIGRLQRQRALWEEIRGFGGDLVDTVLSPDTWSDWGEGGKRVLDMLKQEFTKLALLNPIRNMLLGESNVTLSSVIGSIGKIFGAATSVTPTGAGGSGAGWTGPRAASGTAYASGGDMLVGEFGAEIVRMPTGASVVPAGETRRLLAANDRAPSVSVYNDLRGAVVQEDLYRKMQAIGDGAAVRGAAGGAQLGYAESQARAGRRLGRRW